MTEGRFPVRPDSRSEHETDHDLLRAAREGHATAFSELVRRHQAALLNLAGPFVDSREDAEDAVQEAFVEAWRQLDSFREEASFRTWVGRIALYRAMALSKKPRLLAEDAPGWDAQGTDGAEVADTLAVREAVLALPDDFRLPVVLRFWREMSGREIAELLGWEQSTVWTRIYRGLEQVRRTLEEDGR